jgi:hypothetical protein
VPQNAPRATAAAPAGETLGVRHRPPPGGRTAAAPAGRAPDVQTQPILPHGAAPHGAIAVPLEEADAEDKMDWLPPQQRVLPRHGRGTTRGKRIALQGEQEEADPSITTSGLLETSSIPKGGDPILGHQPPPPQ